MNLLRRVLSAFTDPVVVDAQWPKPDVPKIENCPKDSYDQNPLVCSGCAHSAGSAPFPGRPSGERPCFFCVRNPDRLAWVVQAKRHYPEGLPETHPANGRWYDGSKAIAVPMDCYRSVDMVTQTHIWNGGDAADHLIT